MVRMNVVLFLIVIVLSGCSSRQVQDSLVGSTAQRLVSHSIDDLMSALPADDFSDLDGQRVWIVSHFLDEPELKYYADRRLAIELQRRFGARMAESFDQADQILNVFYTSLGTDQSLAGFYLPLGVVPGMDQDSRINLISLEQFHGVAELYYFLGPEGHETRGSLIQARTRTDALGLPIITIPISSLPDD